MREKQRGLMMGTLTVSALRDVLDNEKISDDMEVFLGVESEGDDQYQIPLVMTVADKGKMVLIGWPVGECDSVLADAKKVAFATLWQNYCKGESDLADAYEELRALGKVAYKIFQAPFPLHDYCTKEDWEFACNFVATLRSIKGK